jgi:hypothetical protein
VFSLDDLELPVTGQVVVSGEFYMAGAAYTGDDTRRPDCQQRKGMEREIACVQAVKAGIETTFEVG